VAATVRDAVAGLQSKEDTDGKGYYDVPGYSAGTMGTSGPKYCRRRRALS